MKIVKALFILGVLLCIGSSVFACTQNPVASFTVNLVPTSGGVIVVLDASSSSDPDGKGTGCPANGILKYYWDLTYTGSYVPDFTKTLTLPSTITCWPSNDSIPTVLSSTVLFVPLTWSKLARRPFTYNDGSIRIALMVQDDDLVQSSGLFPQHSSTVVSKTIQLYGCQIRAGSRL